MIPRNVATDVPLGAVALPVSDGRLTLVDADIAEKLKGRTLHPKGPGYIGFYLGAGRCEYLHRYVCPPPEGSEVDHVNACKADNRRANLRAISHCENCWRSRRRVGRSGYRGVKFQRATKRYRVRVTWRRRTYTAGTYGSALIAAFARDDLARRATGLDEGLNFPGSVARGALAAFLESLGPKLFGVVFVRRRDGAVRRMVCRTGVTRRS